MRFIAFLVSLLITTTVHAASLESKEAARKLTDQVMVKVASGDLHGGLLLMKPYTIIPESEFNVMLEQTKLQLPTIQGRFGKTLGAEFLGDFLNKCSKLRL
jgi:hypothetical protein